jgi:hypothetical protein
LSSGRFAPVAIAVARDAPPRGELEHGIAEVSGEIARRHRNLTFVGFRQIAGKRVKIDGDLARRFGVE